MDGGGEGDDALELLELAEAALDQAPVHLEVLVEQGFAGVRWVTASDRDGATVRDGLAQRIGVAGCGLWLPVGRPGPPSCNAPSARNGSRDRS